MGLQSPNLHLDRLDDNHRVILVGLGKNAEEGHRLRRLAPCPWKLGQLVRAAAPKAACKSKMRLTPAGPSPTRKRSPLLTPSSFSHKTRFVSIGAWEFYPPVFRKPAMAHAGESRELSNAKKGPADPFGAAIACDRHNLFSNNDLLNANSDAMIDKSREPR